MEVELVNQFEKKHAVFPTVLIQVQLSERLVKETCCAGAVSSSLPRLCPWLGEGSTKLL